MFYLIRPDLSFGWVDYLSKDMIAKYELDLEKIQWDDAERQFDEVTLRVAFRYGYAVSKGIAVDVSDLAPMEFLRTVLNIERRNAADLPGIELMEKLVPGWTEETRKLDERVAESHERTVERARAEFLENFAAEVKPELVEHWSQLGGPIPAAL